MVFVGSVTNSTILLLGFRVTNLLTDLLYLSKQILSS